MSKTPSISDAEWEVMTVLWADSPLTASDVVDRVAMRNDWNPRTVKTLLNRLVSKGALGFEVEGKRYHYFPKVTRDACIRGRSRSFLASVFGGAVGPMLAHFINDESLSAEEIRELRRILEKREKKGR